MSDPWPAPLSGVKIIETSVVHDGFFTLRRHKIRHRTFAGGWSPVIIREVLDRGHSAGALLYDPRTDRVVLVEQFRAPALEVPGGPWLIEIVAGMIGPGESPEAVVRREAREEAGCAAGALSPICETMLSPGGASERISLFCAEVDATAAGGIHGLAAENEDIRVVAVPLAAALAEIGGRIIAAPAIICLQWLAAHRAEVRRQWRGAR